MPTLRRIPLLCLAALAVATPAPASAATRTGQAADPQGDVGGVSFDPAACYVPDLSSVKVDYDDSAGKMTAAFTFLTDLGHYCGDSTQYGIELAAGGGSTPTPKATVSMDVNVDRTDGTRYARAFFTVDGTSGYLSVDPKHNQADGTATISPDGHTVTVSFTHPLLAGRDWRKISPTAAAPDPFTAFWFDGYQPAASTGTSPLADPAAPIIDPVTGKPTTATPTGKPTTGTPTTPVGMTIDDGARYTNDAHVTLSVVAPTAGQNALVANDGGFRNATTFKPADTIDWKLDESGSERLPKTVYVRFGASTQTFTDDIILDQTAPTVDAATLIDGATAQSARAAAARAARRFRVRLAAHDRTSGVARVQLAADKRHPAPARPYARTVTFSAVHAPRFVRVRDRAGNYSRWRTIRR
jgi:hypothetical protein